MKNRMVFFPIILVLLISVFIIGDFFYMDLFGIGRRTAKRKLPEVAEKLGFKEKPGSSPKCFNEYSGRYKGHFVKVLPESADVIVYMRPIPNLEISTVSGDIYFETGDARFDGFFTERMAPEDVGRKIAGSTELIEFADQLRSKWKSKCNFIEARSDNVNCSMKYGNGHYIPADVLEPILSDLVRLADLLHQAVNTKVKKPKK